MGILNHLVKTNVVRDALRKKPMAMYLTQQKEILNDMDGFELEVPLSKVTSQLMTLQLQSSLIDKIKKSQVSNLRLEKLREMVETSRETGVSIYLDGSLCYRGQVYVPHGKIREDILFEAYSSKYSICQEAQSHNSKYSVYQDILFEAHRKNEKRIHNHIDPEPNIIKCGLGLFGFKSIELQRKSI